MFQITNMSLKSVLPVETQNPLQYLFMEGARIWHNGCLCCVDDQKCPGLQIYNLGVKVKSTNFLQCIYAHRADTMQQRTGC